MFILNCTLLACIRSIGSIYLNNIFSVVAVAAVPGNVAVFCLTCEQNNTLCSEKFQFRIQNILLSRRKAELNPFLFKYELL